MGIYEEIKKWFNAKQIPVIFFIFYQAYYFAMKSMVVVGA